MDYRDNIVETFKDESIHFIAAIAVFVVLLIYYNNMAFALVGFLSSLIVDIDHLFDYFLVKGFTFDVKAVFTGEVFAASKKIILPLHGWEYAAILLFVFYVTRNPVFVSISLGLFIHYLVDFFTNHVEPLSYFIIYRILIGFDIKRIIKNYACR